MISEQALSPTELADSSEYYLAVDIRPKRDYGKWHIKGSINVDIYDDILNNEFHSAAQKLLGIKTDRKIVVVCNAGITAKIASQMLQSQGKDSSYLEGGMMGWNRLHKAYNITDDGDLLVTQIARIGKGCLSYIIASKSGKECLVVDPSHYVEEYIDIAKGLGFRIKGVIESHIHADHISGGKQLASIVNCELYTPNESKSFTKIKDSYEISIGNIKIKIIGTPGHTNESVCLIVNNKVILTGDTLFLDGVGRPDLSSKDEVKSNAEMLYSSLDKIKALNGNLMILPAHFHEPGSFPVSRKLAEMISSDLFKKSKDEFIGCITSDLQDAPPNYIEIRNINKNFSSITKMQAERLEFGPNRCVTK
ncbi:MBL fold metallo-hydrolase [Candidatus Woesearchaeota archaeon]|nr:MBL fold metallo-hydrolase [Candidatus Woesearchaeota archaeon]MBI2661295.1 MBL fold metallo-hydrolase [Candidatus Woesearchaeota archaeon]